MTVRGTCRGCTALHIVSRSHKVASYSSTSAFHHYYWSDARFYRMTVAEFVAIIVSGNVIQGISCTIDRV